VIVEDDSWLIWGDYLEHHHEDYNIDLLEIMAKFEGALKKANKHSFKSNIRVISFQ